MSKDSKVRDIDLTTVDHTALGVEHSSLITEELGPVAANFSLLGSALCINHGTMKRIGKFRDGDPVEGLREVVEAYLTLDYDNVRHEPPSWWGIITAVSNPMGGNDHSLAKKIAKKFPPGSMTPSISNSTAQMTRIPSTEETCAQVLDVTAQDHPLPRTQHYLTHQLTNNPPYTPGDSRAQTRPRVPPGQSTQPANPNHPHHSQSDTALYQHQHLSGTTSLPPGSVSPHVTETRRHLSEPGTRLSQCGQGRGGLSPLPEQTGNANVQQQGELPTSFSQITPGPPQPNTAQLQLCFNPQTQTIEQCYVPLDVLRGQFQFCQVFDTQTQTVIQCYVPIIALQRQLKFCQVYNPQTRTFVQCHIPIPIPQGQPHGQPHPSAPNPHNMPTAPGYGHNIPPNQHNTPRITASNVPPQAPPTTLYPPQTSPHPQEHQTQHHGRTELIAGTISPTYARSTARGIPSGGDLSQQREVHKVTTTAHQPESMSEGAPDRRAMVGISRSPDIHSEVDSRVDTHRLWLASGALDPYRHGSQSPHPPLRRTPTPGDQYDPNRRTPPPGAYGNQGGGYSNRRTPPPGHRSDNTQSGYFPGADYKRSPHERQFTSTPVGHNSGGFSHTSQPPANQGSYVTPQAGQIPTNTPGYHGNQLPGYPPTQSTHYQLANEMLKVSMRTQSQNVRSDKHERWTHNLVTSNLPAEPSESQRPHTAVHPLKLDREYTQSKGGPEFKQQQPHTQASGRQPGPDHYPAVSSWQPPPGSQSGHQYQQVEQRPPPPVLSDIISLPALRGVEVVSQTALTITNSEQHFHWSGYGLKLYIPPDSLPAGTDSCKLEVSASVAGEYQLPGNHQLVSGVYWVRPHPVCQFQRKLTVEIQHCVKITRSTKLSFVRAVCSQKSLPYTFNKLEGHGSFSEQSSYGRLNVSSFSGLGITAEGPVDMLYIAHLYYVTSGPHNIEIYFTINMDDEAHVAETEKHFDKLGAKERLNLPVEFQDTNISLDIPLPDGIDVEEWNISPLVPPMLYKKRVDWYKPGRTVPSTKLVAGLSENSWSSKVPRRFHRTILKGAKEPSNQMVIELDPVNPSQNPPQPQPVEQLLLERWGLSSCDVDQVCSDDHLLELSHDLGDWEYTARHLGLTDADINGIKYDGQSSIELKQHNTLRKWKSNNLLTDTATYRLLLRALSLMRPDSPGIIPKPVTLKQAIVRSLSIDTSQQQRVKSDSKEIPDAADFFGFNCDTV